MKSKLAVLISHPIQYQVPLFKKLASIPDLDITVYYAWEGGARKSYFDEQFKADIVWDIPLLEGYTYKLLKNFSFRPSANFWGQVNFGIISEIWKNDYDAILVYGWNSFTNWLAFLTAFVKGLPILLSGENPLNQELMKPRWKLWIKKIIFTPFFKRVQGFLYIGKENKKFYLEYGVPESKLFFFPYAVDNERFVSAAQKLREKKMELRKEKGIPENLPVILFVGKLIEKKRPLNLLEAYERSSAVSSFSLVFAGDGVLRKELEEYTAFHKLQHVYFLGFQNQKELPKCYALADIFVLPSGIGETWGLVVNEAMCFGLPIIVSDVVGCGPDLVHIEKNGFVFPVGDIEKLAETLSELAGSQEKRASFGKDSLDIIQNYSYTHDVDTITSLMRNLA